MPWMEFIREDSYVSKDSPNIAITSDRKFMFNSQFVRLAGLNIKQRVVVHIHPETYRIGFEFVTDDNQNSFQLGYQSRGSKSGGLNCTAGAVINRFAWIKAISELKSPQAKRFSPKQDREMGKLVWAIQLCPAFEISESREANNIPSGAKGIYRYKRHSGEIVYIGKGDIKSRLNEPQRREWKFDTIEYSIVEDVDARTKWEEFWIVRFQEENKQQLPMYNKISA